MRSAKFLFQMDDGTQHVIPWYELWTPVANVPVFCSWDHSYRLSEKDYAEVLRIVRGVLDNPDPEELAKTESQDLPLARIGGGQRQVTYVEAEINGFWGIKCSSRA